METILPVRRFRRRIRLSLTAIRTNHVELFELLVRLEESVLHHVFSVFAVLRNVLRYAKYLALVLADQLIVGRDITAADPFNKGYVRMRLEFTCYGLDGRHGGWLRKSL
jgi:hypothetical protein